MYYHCWQCLQLTYSRILIHPSARTVGHSNTFISHAMGYLIIPLQVQHTCGRGPKHPQPHTSRVLNTLLLTHCRVLDHPLPCKLYSRVLNTFRVGSPILPVSQSTSIQPTVGWVPNILEPTQQGSQTLLHILVLDRVPLSPFNSQPSNTAQPLICNTEGKVTCNHTHQST